MMNNALINSAVILATEYIETNKLNTVNKNTIQAMAEDWYNNSDISDAYLLAAAVLEWGYYDIKDWQEVINNGYNYFYEELYNQEYENEISTYEEAEERELERMFEMEGKIL